MTNWKDTIHVMDLELANLESGVSVALPEERATLQSRRENIMAARFKIASKHAPWTYVPVEIMSAIFIAGSEVTVPSSDKDMCFLPGGEAGAISRGLPNILTQVCSRWREIAIETPDLWSKIYYGNSVHSHHPRNLSSKLCPCHQSEVIDTSESQLRLCNTWLDRSKSRPLDVYIIDPIASKLNDLMTLIAAHLPRIRNLTLYLPRLGALDAHIQVLRHITPAPKLRDLRVATHTPSASDFTQLEFIASLPREASPFDFPALQHFQVNNFPLQIFTPALHGLKTLRLTDAKHMTFETLFKVLQANPYLEDLVVHFGLEFLDYRDQSPARAFTLPCLKHLELGAPVTPLFLAIFANLIFPALKKMVLVDNLLETWEPLLSPPPAKVKRFGMRMSKRDVNGLAESEMDAIALAAPTLEYLEVWDVLPSRRAGPSLEGLDRNRAAVDDFFL